jgi:hypothetical protein
VKLEWNYIAVQVEGTIAFFSRIGFHGYQDVEDLGLRESKEDRVLYPGTRGYEIQPFEGAPPLRVQTMDRVDGHS